MTRFHAFFKRKDGGAALLAAAAILLIHVSVDGFSPLPIPHTDAFGSKRQDPVSTCSSNAFSRTVCASRQQTEDDDKSSDPKRNGINVTGVTLKMAFDQDWAVADDAAIKSERFTSPSSLDLVHRLRRDSDAVLVGKTTVQRDNCTLTVRRVPLPKHKRQPVRVVVDPHLSLLLQDDNNGDYALFQDGLDTIVYCRQDAFNDYDDYDDDEKKIPVNDKVLLIPLPTNNNNNDDKLSTVDIISDLNEKRGIHHVMVEGGPATALQFLQQQQQQQVDRAIIIRAPIQFSEPVRSGMSMETLRNAGLELLGTSESDGDVVEYWSRAGVEWPTDELTDWP